MRKIDVTEWTCANCITREDREYCDTCDGSCNCERAVDNGYSVKEAMAFNKEYNK